MPIIKNQRGAGHVLIEVVGVSDTLSTPLLSLQESLRAQETLDNSAVVDLSTTPETVAIAIGSHNFNVGENVTIAGTTNYNGNFEVLSSTNATHIVIESAYMAETPAGSETADIYFEQVNSLDITQLKWSSNVASVARGANTVVQLVGSGSMNLSADSMVINTDNTANVVLTLDAGGGTLLVEGKKNVTLLNAGGPDGRSQY